MAWLRLTLIEPEPGRGDEVQTLLKKLDDCLAASPGMVLSMVTEGEAGRVGRVSLWRSRDEANRVALRDDVLALRSRLRRLALHTEETLMEVTSGHLPHPSGR